jgi:quercetin dioxygenase-like cupin family protein
MNIEGVGFSVVDWSKVPPVEHSGETGTSFWRTVEEGNVRVRKVEYSAGFRSDHWCSRGHILLVLDGKLFVELKDGRTFTLGTGLSFRASDDAANPHLVYTKDKTSVFIVD